MTTDDVTKRRHVKNDQEQTKHCTLGTPWGRGAAVDALCERSHVNNALLLRCV